MDSPFTNNHKVIEYYNQTYISYRLLWGIERNFSIHYGYYDATHKTHDAALINMNRVLADIAGITENDVVLDAGCGIGGSALFLARHYGAQIVGLNINKMHIDRAQWFARKQNLHNKISFQVKDYMDTQLPDQTFDIVWGLESVCYAYDKRKFLQEAYRLLRPGGRIIIADFFLNKDKLAQREQYYLNTWTKMWAIDHFSHRDAFRKYLNDTGYREVNFIDITKNVNPSAKRIYYCSLFSRPLGALLNSIGFKRKMMIQNTHSSYCQYKALQSDVWAYGIFYAKK